MVLCSSAHGLQQQDLDHWESLGVQHVLAGESLYSEAKQRTLIRDLDTTAEDEPQLGDTLKRIRQLSGAAWILLVEPGLQLGESMQTTLSELCQGSSPRLMAYGRSWRPQVGQGGRLDEPTRISWCLIPAGAFGQAPKTLSCQPSDCGPWLIEQGLRSGWRVLDATAAALSWCRPSRFKGALPTRLGSTGAVLPHRPGRPRLSFLVAEHRGQSWIEQARRSLLPDPALPWEVVVAGGQEPLQQAWDQGFQSCQGDLIWPLGGTLPPLALIPAVLRRFDQPQTDLLQLSYSQGGIAQGLDRHTPSPAGTLIVQRQWIVSLGGFGAVPDLSSLKRSAMQLGARCQDLPLCLGEIDP